jgi:hypothetical protein
LVPQALRRLNFVSFVSGESFARALGRLTDSLRVDLPWIREHTRIGELAARWIDRTRDEALLLRGAELQSAQTWLAGWHAGAPPPTDGQRELIAASAEATALRDQVELRCLEEMAQAIASRAEALSLSEGAVRDLRRRTLIGGVTAGGLATGLCVVGWLYARAARERELERLRADEAASRSVVDAARREALRTDLEGQIVVYSTLPGKAAMDESDFTAGLLEQLRSDEVSLGVALARTVQRVIQKTAGRQRPYIATDMNADVYFKTAPPSRQRRALVISVDHFFDRRFRAVERDGDAWSAFLRGAGFDVTWLRNPSRDEATAAIDKMKVADAGWSPARVMPVGTRRRDQPGDGNDRSATPNSFFTFYFSGNGFRDPSDSIDYLFMDTPDRSLTSKDESRAELKKYAVEVPGLTRVLRDRFAASCLILDTNFPVADGLR